MIHETPTGYTCDDPRVFSITVIERLNMSPPIFTLELTMVDGETKKFGGKPFSFTDKLIKEAEAWLATLPADPSL
jgi:hypothetical protein